MAKVFIGNLSDDAKGSDVEDFFRKYGRLREITLKNGFGFVEFDDRRDAEDAVRDLNGQRLAGDRVVVELAGSDRRGGGGRGGGGRGGRSRSRSPRGGYDRRDERRGGGFRGGGRGGGGGRPHRTQWAMLVENLSSRCSWADLKDHCRKYGEVTYTDAHFRTGEGKGEVCFAERDDLEKALDEMDGTEIMGKRVQVSKSTNDGPRGGGGRGGGGRSRSRSPPRRGGRERPHRTQYTVAIENLSSRCDWSQLKDIMRRAGEVCYVDAHNRMGRGRGEVCFGSREVMHKAKEELNGYDINGKRIEIIIKEDGSRSPSPNRSRSRSRSGSRRSRSRSRSRSGDRRSRSRSGGRRSRSRSRSGGRRSRSRS